MAPKVGAGETAPLPEGDGLAWRRRRFCHLSWRGIAPTHGVHVWSRSTRTLFRPPPQSRVSRRRCSRAVRGVDCGTGTAALHARQGGADDRRTHGAWGMSSKCMFVPMTADIGAVLAIEQRVHAFPWTRGNFQRRAGCRLRGLGCREGDVVVGFCRMMRVVDEIHLLVYRHHPDRASVPGAGAHCSNFFTMPQAHERA